MHCRLANNWGFRGIVPDHAINVIDHADNEIGFAKYKTVREEVHSPRTVYVNRRCLVRRLVSDVHRNLARLDLFRLRYRHR